MKRTTTAILRVATAALLALAAYRPAAAGEITYSIVNDSVDQSGWTLSGSITTNGTLGVLTASDISSYTVTFTQGTTVDTFSGNGRDVSLDEVSATARSIEVYFGGQLSILSANSSGLDWTNYSYAQAYTGSYKGENLWNTSAPSGFPAGEAWSVAAVPEPSSLVMGALGTAMVARFGWTRRRAARRSAVTVR